MTLRLGADDVVRLERGREAEVGKETILAAIIHAKVLRVLRKQADGSWKGAVGMWNTAE